MNDIIHPNHYRRRTPEPWDVSIDWELDGLEHNVLKYIARVGQKDGVTADEDYKKAYTYVQKILQELSDVSSYYRYRKRFVHRAPKYNGAMLWEDDPIIQPLVLLLWGSLRYSLHTRIELLEALSKRLKERIE